MPKRSLVPSRPLLIVASETESHVPRRQHPLVEFISVLLESFIRFYALPICSCEDIEIQQPARLYIIIVQMSEIVCVFLRDQPQSRTQVRAS